MINLEDFLKEMSEHDQKIDLANCPHCCTRGDNYGESCAHCGIQLKGYGNGGWFGMNLNGAEKCIHDFVACPSDDDPTREVCRFCERTKDVEEISQLIN